MNNAMAICGEGSIDAERLICIENRIKDNLNRFSECVIDVGRCLNQVKDEKLVPHGEWQAWVEKNTGLSVRSAQRLMQAAREVPNASTLSHLSFSKVQALLALPAGERESFAAEVDAENKSVRELKAAIEAKQAAEKARETEEKKRRALEGEVDRLQKVLDNPPVNAAAQAEIDRLEEELERRAYAEQQAKAELLRLKGDIARGNTSASDSKRLTPEELAAAAQAFIGRAAVFPHMGSELAACDFRTYAAYKEQVDMVHDWCIRAMQALNTVHGEVLEV